MAVTFDYTNQSFRAIELYKEVLTIKKNVFRTNSDYYALSLLNLGVAYANIQHSVHAESYVYQSLKIYEQLESTESQYNHGLALSQYASIKRNLGQLDSAKFYEQKALSIQETIYGIEHQGYYSALTSFSQTLIDAGEYSEAKKRLLECLEIQEKIIGKTHPDYGKTALYLAQVESELSQVDKAYEYSKIALDNIKAAYGEKSAEFSRALNTQANIEFQNMDFRACEKSFDYAQRIFRSFYGDKHLEYATIISNKALYLTAVGDFKEALKLLNTALEINKFNLESQPFSASSGMIYIYSNLSSVYMSINDFTNAEKVLIEASRLAEDVLGTEHPDFARILGNRAKIYAEIGLMDKAFVYYDSSIAILRDTYGVRSLAVAGMINNKASVFLYKAQDSRIEYKLSVSYANTAIDLLIDAISIVKENRANKDLSAEYNNLAEAYRVINNSDSALVYYDYSIEQERKFGGSEASIAITNSNKSLCYLATGKLEEAESLARESIKTKTKIYGSDHPSLKGAYLSLSQIQLAKSDISGAKSSIYKCIDIYENDMIKSFSFFSESEKLAWIKSNSVQKELFSRMAFNYQKALPELLDRFTQVTLTQSAMLLRSAEAIKKAASHESETAIIYDEFLSEKKELGVLSSALSDQDKRVLEKLEKVNSLEKQLADILGESIIKNRQFDVDAFKSSLNADEVYVHYLDFNDPLSPDVLSYFALIIAGDESDVKLIKLCDEKEIQALIHKSAATRKKGVDELYGRDKNLNLNLGQLVVQNIIKTYPNTKRFYYSPTGLLHQISFDAIPRTKSSFYSDSIRFYRVNDPNTFFDKQQSPQLDKFELIGGVDYGSDGDWLYLEGTKTEVESIDVILRQNHKENSLLTGTQASQSKLFEDISTKHPDVIHIASHGFFYPDPASIKFEQKTLVEELAFRGSQSSRYVLNKDPMMRSGIVLANANVENESNEGILSAYDISLKDFSKTSLVVLSACETGLGDVTGSEGVFGLQRAFKMAGVKNMIMSLWQVPDKETSEFMISFYDNLCKSNDIEDAFYKAQLKMKSEYDPYYWAAFILIR